MPTHILPRLAARRFSLAQALHRFFLRRAFQRDRRRLARLDDHLLRDIGISREMAEREARETDWNVPRHWTR